MSFCHDEIDWDLQVYIRTYCFSVMNCAHRALSCPLINLLNAHAVAFKHLINRYSWLCVCHYFVLDHRVGVFNEVRKLRPQLLSNAYFTVSVLRHIDLRRPAKSMDVTEDYAGLLV